MEIRRWAALAALGALAITGGALATACGSGGGGDSKQAAVVAGITYIDNSGFHELDEELTNNEKVPATAHSTAVHIQSVALTTDWPKELKAQAEALAKAMGDYAAAIDTDTPDIAHAVRLSNDAHSTWHKFSTATWDHLAEEAGLKRAGHGESH